MADVRFEPGGALRGALAAPPDKSISHRAALLGGLGEGRTEVRRFLDAADTRSSLAAVEALGARVEAEPDGPDALRVAIEGFGLRGARAPAEPIDVGNAGTLIRLLAGPLAGQEGRRFTLDGDASIRRRPMERIRVPLAQMGARVDAEPGGLPPLRIEGASLHGIDYRLPVASAQVKSCVLLAGLLAEGRTTVRERAESRDHTERMLAASGVDVRVERSRSALPREAASAVVELVPPERLLLPSFSVPGDLSSAGFHLAAALLCGGSDVRVDGVGLNPTRVGLLGILNRMGATIEVTEERHEAGEPMGSVRARAGELRGTEIGSAEIAPAIDELPLVGLLGCFAEGRIRVSGAEELRHKESDRIAGVVDALNAIGGRAEALPDGFVVEGTGGVRGGTIDALGDHRLAMLGAVAGLASREGVLVRGFDCARISYPGFERDLRSLAAA